MFLYPWRVDDGGECDGGRDCVDAGVWRHTSHGTRGVTVQKLLFDVPQPTPSFSQVRISAVELYTEELSDPIASSDTEAVFVCWSRGVVLNPEPSTLDPKPQTRCASQSLNCTTRSCPT